MEVNITNSYGCHCSSPEGCYVTLHQPMMAVNNGLRLQQIRVERLYDESRNFYMLLDGTVHLKYASDEAAYPISTPYTSNDWTDYVNNWVYTENVKIKLTESTFFCWLYVKDPLPNNVRVKVAKLDAGTTTKSVPANSHLIIVREDNVACEIDGVLQPDNRNTTEVRIDSARDITINVATRSYLICMQSE